MSLETIKSIELELLAFEEFEEELELMEGVLPALANIRDEDLRRELPGMLEEYASGASLEMEEMIIRFDLLLRILQDAADIEAVSAEVDKAYQDAQEKYEENMQEVYSQTKPFERKIRSLNLLYENAGGEAEVVILPVSDKKFADSANPKHFEEMRHYLKEKFYAWQMDHSPFYITYVGDIGSKSAMDKMAEAAMETRALAIVDIKEMSSAKAVMDYADRLKITGIPAKLGHLVIPASWVYVQGAKDIEFIRDVNGRLKRVEKQMAVPTAPALVGKLLDVRPGEYISGLEADAIIGINGVKVVYKYERIDAKELDKRGLVQIENYGHIQGATTANKSNNADLRKFPKVDTANALLKDLLQHCNNKACSKWGKKEKKEFQREIENYLNRRIKSGLIQGYDINKIDYDPLEENVEIDITVNFYEVADEFDISLHGPQGGIDIKKEE